MLTTEQQREHMKLIEEMKWDRTYKLPEYVERYINMMAFALPNIEIRPWTQMRAVSFFYKEDYLLSLSYDRIETIMEVIEKKEPWYKKVWRRK